MKEYHVNTKDLLDITSVQNIVDAMSKAHSKFHHIYRDHIQVSEQNIDDFENTIYSALDKDNAKKFEWIIHNSIVYTEPQLRFKSIWEEEHECRDDF